MQPIIIEQPGFVADMTNADYHGRTRAVPTYRPDAEPFHILSSTGLRRMAHSPSHWLQSVTRPSSSTPAQQFGTILHEMVLEPDAVPSWTVKPATYTDPKSGEEKPWHGGAKPCKEWAAANSDKIQISPDDKAKLDAMMDAVRNHPAASSLLFGDDEAHAELSGFWTDFRGFWCKLRFDRIVLPAHDRPVVIDLKSTMDASPEGFAKEAANRLYHWQAAWYVDGAATLDVHGARFVFVAVEKAPPFAVGVYEVGPEAIQAARMKYERVLDRFAECLRTDEWPGYSDEIEKLALPPWATREARPEGTDFEGDDNLYSYEEEAA